MAVMQDINIEQLLEGMNGFVVLLRIRRKSRFIAVSALAR
ncbi:hypothetical protein MDMS009_1622 [Methylophaga thiooxydans DMS010]|uniref:Uncharacterized protein n=2 Tax=Methylophaga thiooxydans TaxID=392484 RepID=C0N5Y9_9GAMM|nr:hypothetical protein MDMS009_1622 [Methylophaga thiooxydans DMS010]